MAKVELALDCHAVLGESPMGLPDGRVLFVDINGKKILGLDTVAGKGLPVFLTEQMPGCIAPRAGGNGLIAGLEDCVALLDLPSTEIDGIVQASPLALLPESLRGPKKRCNDGKCDPQGRFWVGTMHSSWREEEAPRGALLCTHKTSSSTSIRGEQQPQHGEGEEEEEKQEGSVHAWDLVARVEGTRLSNGLAWSLDSPVMFYIDSALRAVDCFDFDLEQGTVSNRRRSISFSDSEPRVPDGMCIDAAGKLWVVVGESGSVRQMDPETGKELSRVLLPVKRPTSCAFGGKDLSELYITTREETGLGPHPSAGGLYKALIPGVKGLSFADAFKM